MIASPTMRSGYIIYSLCAAAAPLAMGAPARPHFVLVKNLGETESNRPSGPTAYQPPATITTAGAEGPRTGIPQRPGHEVAIGEAPEASFDNRPLQLPTSELSRLASALLSSDRPLSSDLLKALSLLQSTQDLPGGQEPEPSTQKTMHVGSLVRPGESRGEDMLRTKGAMAHGGHLSAPKAQHQHPCGVRHADVLVIGMGIIFLFVVVMMETWRPVTRTVRRVLIKEGAIRLQGDVETVRFKSARAPGLDIPETIDEKGEEAYEDEDDSDCGAEPWVI